MGVAVFTLLAGYFFWVKVAVVGLLVAIVVVGMVERVLHTTYLFRRVKPVDRDDEMEYLIVSEGRSSVNRNVPLRDVTGVRQVRTCLGLDTCLVIEYGYGNMVTVQPDNPEAFVREMKRRMKNEE